MKSPALKKFQQSRKVQLAFCGVGLVFSLLLLFWQFGDSVESLIPSEERLDVARRELKKATAAYQEAEGKANHFDAVSKAYQAQLAGCWNPAEHGDPDLELRKRIENAARKQEMKLNSIGSVRRSRITNELSFLEVDISVTETLARLTTFFAEIANEQPKLYWKRMELRPAFRQDTGTMSFSGTLRLIALSTDNTAKTARKD